MPYQAFRSQSRVEFIKKKFESSLSEESDTELLKQKNTTIPCKPNFIQEFKNLNLDDNLVNLKFEVNNANKNEGKALVKRSPAFRREKLGSAKSLTHFPLQKSTTFVELRGENLNVNAQESNLKKAGVSDSNIWKDIIRSKTDTNLLKHCRNRVTEKKTFIENSKISEISNSLICSMSKDSECYDDKKTTDSYSDVKKKKNNADKNEAVNLRLSESIRRALQSPLPKGPPPKKPPRTFCHAPSLTQTSPLITSISTSATTKTDIPKLKSKLDKLEKLTRIHKTGTLSDETKSVFSEQINKISEKVGNCSVPDKRETSQSCLPISQCLNQSTKVSNIKKVSKSKSEFYFEIDKVESNLLGMGKNEECCMGSTIEEPQKDVSNPEAIYDLPCRSKKNSFETFGKCSKDLKDSVNVKKADLHYMCTDVINQTPKCPELLSHIDWRKSIEEKSLTEIIDLKSNFLTVIASEKHNSFNLNKSDDVKGVVNGFKEEKWGEKKKKRGFAAAEEGTEESESDLPAVNSFDCNETKNKSDAQEGNLYCTTDRSQTYVSRASSKVISQIPCWKYKNKNSYKHLFECCLLVGLTLCESKHNVPYIKSIFPSDTKPPPLIEFLCFPDASYWPPTSEIHYPEEQCYSLVITNENGERKFGYCRRVLPEGGHVCLPLAYCIISPHRAGGFFHKVLEELESKHGSPFIEYFIKQLYESEFPGPGERLKLREILEATRSDHADSDAYTSSTLVRRPLDVRLEEKDLTQFFRHSQLSVSLKVFSSLLHERKILLLSNSLRNLSSCIEALQSILLPFSWQHTCVPLLPVHLIEMCEAPTPYVIGLLKSRKVEEYLTNVNFEGGILVDLDDSKILKCCGDEGSILPSRLVRDLKTSLNLAMNSSDLSPESVKSVLISDAFIRFFVQVCGNYPKFIQSFSNGDKIFQKDEFIKSGTSDTMQSFLDWFTETAMFNSFIQERLQDDEEDMVVKLFRRRAMEYSEKNLKDSAVLLKNYRVINKKVKTLGGKIKDFTSFAE